MVKIPILPLLHIFGFHKSLKSGGPPLFKKVVLYINLSFFGDLQNASLFHHFGFFYQK